MLDYTPSCDLHLHRASRLAIMQVCFHIGLLQYLLWRTIDSTSPTSSDTTSPTREEDAVGQFPQVCWSGLWADVPSVDTTAVWEVVEAGDDEVRDGGWNVCVLLIYGAARRGASRDSGGFSFGQV